MRNLLFFSLLLASGLVYAAGGDPQPAPQNLVDRAILQIMSTPTGKRALCPFALQPQTGNLYIGASASVAAQVRAMCAGTAATKQQQRVIENMESQVLSTQRRAAGKKFYSIGFSNEFKGIESYTQGKNGANATFFMMTPEEMNSVEFVRALAHEYAMSYDQLNRLGYLDDPLTWEPGLTTFLDPTLITLDPKYPLYTFFERACVARSEECGPGQTTVPEISCAVRDPGIRYALATERAYRFEDQVIAELGLTKSSPNVASGSFAAAIRRHALLSNQFKVLMNDELGRFNFYCGEPAKDLRAREQEISKRAHFLENLTLKYLKTSKPVRMQDLLTEPHVGPFIQDFDGGGPRPRDGGWGGG